MTKEELADLLSRLVVIEFLKKRIREDSESIPHK